MKFLLSTQRSRGASILEITLALSLGAIIAAGGLQYYVVSYGLNLKSKIYQSLNEDGTNALNQIGSFIKDAGNGGPGRLSQLNPVEPAPPNCTVSGFCSLDSNTSPDTIAIRLRPQNNRACNGQPVDVNEVIINRFYLDTTNSILRCDAWSVTNNRVIPPLGKHIQNNVVNMQIQYNLSDESVISSPNIPASESVWGITVSFLMTSDIGITRDTQAATYRLLDASDINFAAGEDKAYQIYQSTFPVNTAMVSRSLSGL